MTLETGKDDHVPRRVIPFESPPEGQERRVLIPPPSLLSSTSSSGGSGSTSTDQDEPEMDADGPVFSPSATNRNANPGTPRIVGLNSPSYLPSEDSLRRLRQPHPLRVVNVSRSEDTRTWSEQAILSEAENRLLNTSDNMRPCWIFEVTMCIMGILVLAVLIAGPPSVLAARAMLGRQNESFMNVISTNQNYVFKVWLVGSAIMVGLFVGVFLLWRCWAWMRYWRMVRAYESLTGDVYVPDPRPYQPPSRTFRNSREQSMYYGTLS